MKLIMLLITATCTFIIGLIIGLLRRWKEECDIFISYRTDGGKMHAKLAYDLLTKKGYSVFMADETMHTGKFAKQIGLNMAACKDFVFILSKGALDKCIEYENDWIRQEVRLALKLYKNIVILCEEDVEIKGVQLPKDIERLKDFHAVKFYTRSKINEVIMEEIYGGLETKPKKVSKKSTLIIFAIISIFTVLLSLYTYIFGTPFTNKTDGVSIELTAPPEETSASSTPVETVEITPSPTTEIEATFETTVLSESEEKEIVAEATALMDETEYLRAYTLLKEIPDNPQAQAAIGDMYRYGYGLEQSYSDAIEWYTLAAEQDEAWAQCALGDLYRYGQGVEQDYSKALDWYFKSEEQHNPYAHCALGDLYRYGQGVEQDYEEAYKWYKLAAEHGLEWAQCGLADLYRYGQGVEQNYGEALNWYLKSAEQNNGFAQCGLGDLYRDGLGVEQNYTEAATWYTLASEQNVHWAQCALGYLYYNGYGIEQNYEKALELYEKAAEQDNAYALYYAGEMYYYGDGVEKNLDKAIEYLERGAEMDNQESVRLLEVISK